MSYWKLTVSRIVIFTIIDKFNSFSLARIMSLIFQYFNDN